MVPQRGMQPSNARDSGQVDPRRSTADIPPPQSAALSSHPIARRLILINRPSRDGTLSWRWYTAAVCRIRTHDLAVASPVRHRTTRLVHCSVEYSTCFSSFWGFASDPNQGSAPGPRWGLPVITCHKVCSTPYSAEQYMYIPAMRVTVLNVTVN